VTNVDDLLRVYHKQKATREDIYFCFRLILGRNPNPEELSGHMFRIGEDLTNVVTTYLLSEEFKNRNITSKKDKEKTKLTTYDGFSIYSHEDDIDVGKFVAQHQYEPEIQKVFQRFLTPGMVVVDIGANIGFFTMLAASLVGPAGRVIAIEPNPANVTLLEASRRANNFEQIAIHSIAAHSTDGILVLNTSHSNGSVRQPSSVLDILLTSNVVPGFQLDRILELQRLDLVKIDVEGAEFEALSGFRDALKLHRPTIISEFAPSSLGGKCEAYLQFLIDLKYRLGVVMPDGDILDCGTERSLVLAEWAKRNTDHIDIIAINKPLN